MKIIGAILGLFGIIVVIIVVGNVMLTEFPQLQPVWDECKLWVSTIYRKVQAEYGTPLVIIFTIGAIALFATSAKKAS